MSQNTSPHTQMGLTEEEINLIINTLWHLPNSKYWEVCKTTDQETYWLMCRFNYMLLSQDLCRFFNGQVSILETCVKQNLINEKFKDFIEVASLHNVYLYTTIRLAFDLIKTEAQRQSKKIKNKNDPALTNALLVINQAQTPGELLTNYLELQSLDMFDWCQKYTSINPRKFRDSQYKVEKTSRDIYKNTVKLNTEFYLNQANLASDPDLINTLRSQLQKVQDLQNTLSKLNNKIESGKKQLAYWSYPLINLYISPCTNHLKKQKWEALRLALSSYHESEASLKRIFLNMTHPDNSVKGAQWLNGTLLPL